MTHRENGTTTVRIVRAPLPRVLLSAVLLIAASGSAGAAGNLKPLDPLALRAAVASVGSEFLVPGAMVLLRTPEGDFAYGYGTSVLGDTTPPASDTHFRIASNTKTMTAATAVLLVQDGKLRFEDPVSKYVDGVPNGDDIRVSDLLKMRSGLPEFTSAPAFMAILDQDLERVWTPEELLAIAFASLPLAAPGTEFHYCNTNYLLLGLIIERVEGTPLAQVFHDRLFGPLGMKDTSLPARTATALPAPYAHGYMFGAASYAMTDAPYSADLQAAARGGTLDPTDYTNQNPSYASAAGGVISTADDLAIWMRALIGGEVLNPEFQRQWFDSLMAQDPGAPDGQKYGYGIGQVTFDPNQMYFHGGEMPGYNSFMGYDPINDVTLVVWSNLTLSPDGQHPANSIMLKILDGIYAASPLQPNR